MKSTKIELRVSEGLKALAKKKAESENRTLSNYIENLIRKDLEESEFKIKEVK